MLRGYVGSRHWSECFEFFRNLLKFKLLQLVDKLLIPAQPRSYFVAVYSLWSLNLRKSLEQKNQRLRISSGVLQSSEFLLQQRIVEFMPVFVEGSGVGKSGSVETGEPDWERFTQAASRALVVQFAIVDILQFFGSEVGGLLFEDSFEIVGLLVGPSILAGNLHLARVADKHVLRPHVAQLLGVAVEAIGSTDNGINEVPEFCLLKRLVLHLLPVVDLVEKQVGVVFVLELDRPVGTQAMPPLPQNSVFSYLWATGR